MLTEKERSLLEIDNDPITLVSDRLTAFVGQSSDAGVSDSATSTMDVDIQGLNANMSGCMRILGMPSQQSNNDRPLMFRPASMTRPLDQLQLCSISSSLRNYCHSQGCAVESCLHRYLTHVRTQNTQTHKTVLLLCRLDNATNSQALLDSGSA